MTTADADDADLRGETQLLHGDVSRTIIGAFYSVHSELGFGFLESVYLKAMVVVLDRAGIGVARQVPYEIMFRGRSIGLYRADLVVASRIIVEIKTGSSIIPQHSSQLLNYLKASGLQIGLLLNFGKSAQFKRVVLTRDPPR